MSPKCPPRFPLAMLAGLLVLLPGPSKAASQTQNAPSFEPVKVVPVVDTDYPVTSAATGTVILRVDVDKSGGIDRVKVVHGIATLTEVAEQAVRKWKYEPARLDGKPVGSATTVSFGFAIWGTPAVPWNAGSEPQGKSAFEPVRILSAISAIYPIRAAVTDIAQFPNVTLRVTVDKSGDVNGIDVIHAVPPLTNEAEKAARRWKLLPAELNGNPITSTFIAQFVFWQNRFSHYPGTRR